MIKLCEVLTFNKYTHTVVAKYDNIQIQFITDREIVGSCAYIKKVGVDFIIVDASEYKKSLIKKVKAESKTAISDKAVCDSGLN